MNRRTIVAVTLFLFCASAAYAESPISLRILGGMTEALQDGLTYEADNIAPTVGLGARYELAEQHSIFLDIEYIPRWSDVPADADNLRSTSSHYRLRAYPFTLGYQFHPWHAEHRFAPFLMAGVTYAGYELHVKERFYSPIEPERVIYNSGSSTAWDFGFVTGLGCAVDIGDRFSLSGVMQYRYASDVDFSYPFSMYGSDTYQNTGDIILPIGAFYDGASLSGPEARLVLEIRL